MSVPHFSFIAAEDLPQGPARLEKVQGVCLSCRTKKGEPRVVSRIRSVDILHPGSRRGRIAIVETLRKVEEHDMEYHDGRGKTRINFTLVGDYASYKESRR